MMPVARDILTKVAGQSVPAVIVERPKFSWGRVQGVVVGVVCTSATAWQLDCQEAYKALEDAPSGGLASEELWNIVLVSVLPAPLSASVAREIERDLRGSRKIAATTEQLPLLFGSLVEGTSSETAHLDDPIPRVFDDFAGKDSELRDALALLLAHRRDRPRIERLIALLARKTD